MNLDDHLQDADEEILDNIVPTKSKSSRGMGLEYSKAVPQRQRHFQQKNPRKVQRNEFSSNK